MSGFDKAVDIASIALDQRDEMKARAEADLQAAQREADAMRQLIADIVDMTRGENRFIPFHERARALGIGDTTPTAGVKE